MEEKGTGEPMSFRRNDDGSYELRTPAGPWEMGPVVMYEVGDNAPLYRFSLGIHEALRQIAELRAVKLPVLLRQVLWVFARLRALNQEGFVFEGPVGIFGPEVLFADFEDVLIPSSGPWDAGEPGESCPIMMIVTRETEDFLFGLELAFDRSRGEVLNQAGWIFLALYEAINEGIFPLMLRRGDEVIFFEELLGTTATDLGVAASDLM